MFEFVHAPGFPTLHEYFEKPAVPADFDTPFTQEEISALERETFAGAPYDPQTRHLFGRAQGMVDGNAQAHCF